MKFTPNCTVCYHGEFHRGGVPFEIDEADADELSKLGEIERPVYNSQSFEFTGESADACTGEKEEPLAAKSEEPGNLPVPPRRGRPRKVKGGSI